MDFFIGDKVLVKYCPTESVVGKIGTICSDCHQDPDAIGVEFDFPIKNNPNNRLYILKSNLSLYERKSFKRINNMSIHTILSQMEIKEKTLDLLSHRPKETDKEKDNLNIFYTFEYLFNSFATRIVEETRKEERANKRKWAKEHPEKMAENHKRFREKRIRNGLCVDCGDIAVTMTLCEKHRLIAIERYNKRRPSYRR